VVNIDSGKWIVFRFFVYFIRKIKRVALGLLLPISVRPAEINVFNLRLKNRLELR